MIEVKKEIEIDKPLNFLLEYFMDPKNIMKYIPYFKEIHQVDNNRFKVKVKWLFSLEFNVIRIYNKLNNEIIYLISREGGIKVNGQLIHYIYKIWENRSKVLIRFIYEGPFESLVKRQAMKFMDNISIKVFEEIKEKEEIREVNSKDSLKATKVLKQGIIRKDEVEKLIDFASVESVNTTLQLLLSDGEKVIKIVFENGELKEASGDISSLKSDNVKYIIRITS